MLILLLQITKQWLSCWSQLKVAKAGIGNWSNHEMSLWVFTVVYGINNNPKLEKKWYLPASVSLVLGDHTNWKGKLFPFPQDFTTCERKTGCWMAGGGIKRNMGMCHSIMLMITQTELSSSAKEAHRSLKFGRRNSNMWEAEFSSSFNRLYCSWVCRKDWDIRIIYVGLQLSSVLTRMSDNKM